MVYATPTTYGEIELKPVSKVDNVKRDKNGDETVESFLARGGNIKKVAAAELPIKPESVKSSNAGGPAVFLSLGEADLFYGEKKNKKPKKSKAAIDLSALPEELRKKYVDGVVNGTQEEAEEDQDDSED